MQDIVFYVAANETLGKVRDYSNMRNSDAPLLTLGVGVCLRMRLFDDIEVSTPYPIASFSGITDWDWRMDADFNRSTVCKLAADADGVSVHTVSDTVNGKTMNFTEFVIPISNMNTEELAAWLGNEGTKSGLTGELVGYDNGGHAVFVLQIEDFSVRNRVAGLGDPTAVDQEIITRTQAEQMIQTAVSASAATKQDKLGSGNAGIGISISSAGVISTAGVPQSAVTGLSASLAAKQDKLNSGNAGTGISISSAGTISTANVPQSAVTGLEADLNNKQNSLSTGFWIEINDDWISVERYHAIHEPYSRGTVSMQAGEAYKIYATTSAVTLDAENIPNNTWGLDGHAEIFVANTGYVQTTSHVVLANALEPDAVNNCTVRFHDGLAIISVEDHVAGYIVVYASGSTSGTLPYGIGTAEQEYIAFDAALNGSTIDLSGSTANSEKHIVGNGYTSTTLTGEVNCGTSKFTVANLSLRNVSVTGGVMTLGDVYVLSGAIVSAPDLGLVAERVALETGSGTAYISGGTFTGISGGMMTGPVSVLGGFSMIGSGATVNLNGGQLTDSSFKSGTPYTLSGITFIGGSGGYGGALSTGTRWINITCDISGCTFSGNHATSNGGAFNFNARNGYSCTVNMTSCIVSGNTAAGNPNGALVGNGVVVNIADSLFDNGGADFLVQGSNASTGQITELNLSGSTVMGDMILRSGKITFGGNCFLGGSAYCDNSSGSGIVVLSSGAVLDLTGNTNATPIAPDGGITFASGGATVKVGDATASSSYMINNVTLPAGAKLTNTAVVDFGGTRPAPPNGAVFSGVMLTNMMGSNGGVRLDNASASFFDCTIYNPNPIVFNRNGTALFAINSNTVASLVRTVVSGNTDTAIDIVSSAMVSASDCTILDRIRLRNGGRLTCIGSNVIGLVSGGDGGGSVTLTSGATLDLTGNTRATPIAPGGGITFESGGATVYPSAGSAGAYVLGGVTLTSLGNTNVISGGMATVTSDAVIKDCAIAGATVTIPTAATVSLLGTSVDVPLSGTIIVADGDGDASIELINNAGASVQINGGTYTSIAKDGTATE